MQEVVVYILAIGAIGYLAYRLYASMFKKSKGCSSGNCDC